MEEMNSSLSQVYLNVSECNKPDWNLNLVLWFLIPRCYPVPTLHIQCLPESTIYLYIEYYWHIWSDASAMYLKIFGKIQRNINIILLVSLAILLVMTWYLSFSHFSTTVMLLPCAFSTHIFMPIVLMSFPLWYLDFLNLSIVLEWQLGLIILLLKLLDITTNSLLIVSSHTLHTCGTLQLLALKF